MHGILGVRAWLDLIHVSFCAHIEMYVCTNACIIYICIQMPDLNVQSKYKWPTKIRIGLVCWGWEWGWGGGGELFFLSLFLSFFFKLGFMC